MSYFYSHADDKRALLSTLWIFVLINQLFRDLHEFLSPGVLSEVESGYLHGTQLTDGLLLAGGIMVELQIAMVVLVRVLPRTLNQWVNITIAALSILFVFNAEHTDLDDILFAMAQIIGLIAIIWVALPLPRFADILSFTERPTRP